MKKLISMILMCSLCLVFVACGNQESQNTTPPANTVNESSQQEPEMEVDQSTSEPEEERTSNDSAKDTNSELLDKITVEAEIDQALYQAVVLVTNNSGMTFSGNISTYFYDAADKSVGSDMIFVEDLPTGNQTYAKISIDSVTDITMKYDISSPSFVEGASNDDGTLNEEASAALAKDFEDSFGGAGNPEWATSWYKFVTLVEVYSTESSNYAVITVGGDADEESIDRIGNAIFGNYSKSHNLGRVLVTDDEGNTVFDKAA